MALWSQQRLVGVDARLIKLAFDIASQVSFHIHVVDKGGLRTDKDEAELYASGRDANGNIVDQSQVKTYAATAAESAHGSGLALDLAPYDLTLRDTDWSDPDLNDKLSQIGELAKAQGFTWGGDWAAPKTDMPHVELANWQDEVNAGNAGPGVVGGIGNALGVTTTTTLFIIAGGVMVFAAAWVLFLGAL